MHTCFSMSQPEDRSAFPLVLCLPSPCGRSALSGFDARRLVGFPSVLLVLVRGIIRRSPAFPRFFRIRLRCLCRLVGATRCFAVLAVAWNHSGCSFIHRETISFTRTWYIAGP